MNGKGRGEEGWGKCIRRRGKPTQKKRRKVGEGQNRIFMVLQKSYEISGNEGGNLRRRKAFDVWSAPAGKMMGLSFFEDISIHAPDA